ncbi:MAG: hypothetical protein Q7W30_09740 [Coriobacteriia bacterium]|nr:hypothetical protein [Coriobacteriia bacterium]
MRGSLATAAILIAVAAIAISPNLGTVAFARDKAATALLFHTPGRVLHVEMTYTHESGAEPKSTWLNQRWSVWVDPEARRLREQFVNAQDESLAAMRVRIDGRSRAYWFSNNRQGLVETDVSMQPLQTVMEDEVSYMRARIDDGSAKVIGTQVIDGQECWVVESRTDDGAQSEILNMALRKSDYQPKTWQRTTSAKDASGAARVTTKRIAFNLIENLEPGTMPADFFSFEAVTGAVLPGIPIVR